MAEDDSGNDVEQVGVPVGGYLAVAFNHSVDVPTPVEGKELELELDLDFSRAGLLKEDGGFEWEEEADGDPIQFWQDGYEIPTGKANVTLSFTTAEDSELTRKLRTGKTPDANGYVTVNAGAPKPKITVFTEEVFTNGRIRRRAARGQVGTAKLQKSERGDVQGVEFEVTIQPHADFGGGHYGEWLISPGEED